MQEGRQNLFLQHGGEFVRLGGELSGRRGVVGQHLHQEFELGKIGRLQLAVHSQDDGAEVPHQPVRPFDVPPEPVEIVGHAAGQVVAAAAELDGGSLRAEQSDRGDGPIGKDPDVLAARAAGKLFLSRTAGRRRCAWAGGKARARPPGITS